MAPSTGRAQRESRLVRRLCRLGLVAALSAACAGCGDEIAKEFRSAAIPGFEAALRGVADGLISGFVALNTPSS